MKTYKVSFTVELCDESSHPNTWIPDSINFQLEEGLQEVTYNWVFDEVKETDTKLIK